MFATIKLKRLLFKTSQWLSTVATRHSRNPSLSPYIHSLYLNFNNFNTSSWNNLFKLHSQGDGGEIFQFNAIVEAVIFDNPFRIIFCYECTKWEHSAHLPFDDLTFNVSVGD